VALISFIKGFPPILAVETARRNIPSACRPTFTEMEKFCKNSPAAATPPAAPAPAAAA
jgi:chemotaxis protein MotA